MKINIGKILSVAGVVRELVHGVQSQLKDAKGVEKHEVVAEAVKDVVPVIEAVVGKDLVSDDTFIAAINRLIVAEKAALNAAAEVKAAKAAVDAVIADIKTR